VAKSKDPKERRSESVLQRIQSRIPILREKLQPQVNILGQERDRVGNAFEVMLDPTRPSPNVSSSVTKELRRLTDAGYKVSPTLLGDRKGYDVLTQEQNTELWVMAGSITNEKLTNLFALKQYASMNKEDKTKTIESVVNLAKVNARAGMVLKLTEGLQGAELIAKLSELKTGGLVTEEVLNKYKELR